MMPVLSLWQFLIMLTGFFSPKVIAFVQNPVWPRWKKILVNLGFHAIIAFAYLGAAGQINHNLLVSSQNFISLLGQLSMYSILSYCGVWKPEQINSKAMSTKRKLGILPPKEGDHDTPDGK